MTYQSKIGDEQMNSNGNGVKLTKIVACVLAVEEKELSDESHAKNTRNWDSLRHIELVLAVELAFGVKFSMPEITGLQNLGDMRQLLITKGAHP